MQSNNIDPHIFEKVIHYARDENCHKRSRKAPVPHEEKMFPDHLLEARRRALENIDHGPPHHVQLDLQHPCAPFSVPDTKHATQHQCTKYRSLHIHATICRKIHTSKLYPLLRALPSGVERICSTLGSLNRGSGMRIMPCIKRRNRPPSELCTSTYTVIIFDEQEVQAALQACGTWWCLLACLDGQ